MGILKKNFFDITLCLNTILILLFFFKKTKETKNNKNNSDNEYKRRVITYFIVLSVVSLMVLSFIANSFISSFILLFLIIVSVIFPMRFLRELSIKDNNESNDTLITSNVVITSLFLLGEHLNVSNIIRNSLPAESLVLFFEKFNEIITTFLYIYAIFSSVTLVINIIDDMYWNKASPKNTRKYHWFDKIINWTDDIDKTFEKRHLAKKTQNRKYKETGKGSSEYWVHIFCILDYIVNVFKMFLKFILISFAIPFYEVSFYVKRLFTFLSRDTKKAIVFFLRLSIALSIIFFYYNSSINSNQIPEDYKEFVNIILVTIILSSVLSSHNAMSQSQKEK